MLLQFQQVELTIIIQKLSLITAVLLVIVLPQASIPEAADDPKIKFKFSSSLESRLIDFIVFKITNGKKRITKIAIPCQTVLQE